VETGAGEELTPKANGDPAPAVTARSLVLLHGFTHTGASWNGVQVGLGERYASMAPDIRGHGSASRVEPVELAGVRADVAGLAPDRFGLVGYSMGGRLALHVALAMPERIERLVLIGASPGIASALEREARRRADEALAARLERMSIEEFAVEWARTPVLAGLPEHVLAAVHADRLRNTPTGLARALRGLGTGALSSLWDRLGELRMPVTLVVGERDAKFQLLAEQMQTELPQARVAVVDGAGHAVHLEAPAQVARIVAGDPATGSVSERDTSRAARRPDRVRRGR
jgi:2-succinyl-6-hydroxy-2,4-cyclohexadiene-1-carboxylate synthase